MLQVNSADDKLIFIIYFFLFFQTIGLDIQIVSIGANYHYLLCPFFSEKNKNNILRTIF